MKSPQNAEKQSDPKKTKSANEIQEAAPEPCACCAVFFSDYAVQELEHRWNSPRGLRALINELLEEGFGHFAKSVLWRWHKLVPNSPDYDVMLCRISDQIWLAGSSKTIHSLDKPMTDADIERAVAHDMALLQHEWARDANMSAQLRKGRKPAKEQRALG